MPTSLESVLHEMQDMEAIKQLKARYCEACDDDHNPDRVAALFLPERLWEGKEIGIHARGHEATKAAIRVIGDSGRIRNSAHRVFNPIVQVSGDRATATWRLLMMYTAKGTDGALSCYRIIGRYADDYVRMQDGWYFDALRVTVEENGAYSVER